MSGPDILPEHRSLINQIFMPRETSPWGRFPRDMLERHDFHSTTIMFYHANTDVVAVVLHRKEPSSPRYVGNFPCGETLMKRLAIFERVEKLSAAYFVTAEAPEGPEVLCAARASTVADRCLGRVMPMRSPISGDDYYWLDVNLVPVVPRWDQERKYRMLSDDPPFLMGRQK
jgi:hypothetical protein